MNADKYKERNKTRGFCCNCGSRKPKPGCVTCVHCLSEKQKTQIDLRAERRERGLCPNCGKRPPIPNRWGCFTCMSRHRIAKRKFVQRQKEKLAT